MPSERINACDPHTYADLSVGWPTQEDLTDDYPEQSYVSVMPLAPKRVKGGIYLCPDHDSDDRLGLADGDAGVGPVHIKLDRAGVNKLISTLRQARDEAFGADA